MLWSGDLKAVNIFAPVLPGIGCGGLKIGDHISDIELNSVELIKVYKSEIQEKYGWIHGAVKQHQNIMVVDDYADRPRAYVVYIGGYDFRIDFDDSERIVQFTTGEGYKGCYKDKVSAGCYLYDVLDIMPLEFNGFDDVYFSVDAFSENNKIERKEHGIGFLAPEVEGDFIGEQKIEGFYIF